jgi:hypothetical protein
MPNLTLDNNLDHNAKPIKVDGEMTPLEVSTNKLWYQKTPTDSYELANKKYVDNSTQYFYDVKFSSYYTTATSNYVPLNGSTSERTSLTGSNETLSWVAPYNGTIEKAFFRSEALQNGTFEINTYYSADGTEIPTTLNMRFVDAGMDIADDITYEADFTGSLYAGDNTIVKGRIYSIKVSTPANSLDTNITFVFKWDLTI